MAPKGKKGFDGDRPDAYSARAKQAKKAKDSNNFAPASRKRDEPPVEDKTKAQIEESRRRFVQEKDADRKHLIQLSNEQKRMESKHADEAFTLVEIAGKDPIKVADLDPYWVNKDLRFLPFLPHDEVSDDLATYLAFLKVTVVEFEYVLRAPFHVFWSHMLLTPLPRVIESYLRFSPRPQETVTRGKNLYSDEVETQEQHLSKLAFIICIRSSKRGESSRETLSEKKFSAALKMLWDLPTLLDFCTLYGKTNSHRVTSLVHEVFDGCPALFEELTTTSVALREAFDESLKHAEHENETWVYVEDCLSCLEALQAHFPLVDDDGSEDLKRLTSVFTVAMAKGKTEVKTHARYAMCRLAEKKWKVDADDPIEKKERTFTDFEEWILAQDEHIMEDAIWAPVFEHWKRIKGVDEERIDYYLRLSGAQISVGIQRVGPKEVGGAASSSTAPAGPSAERRRKIRDVLDVLPEYGEGWAHLCLEHYDRVDELVDATFSDQLPAALSVISKKLTLQQALDMQTPQQEKVRIDVDKAQIMQQMERMDEEDMRVEEEERIAAHEMQRHIDLEYDDEPTGADDFAPIMIHAGERDSDDDDEPQRKGGKGKKGKGADSDDDEPRKGRKGAADSDDESIPRKGGKGGGKKVQGQSFDAHKKEQNKSSRANHNRRNRFAQKLNRGML